MSRESSSKTKLDLITLGDTTTDVFMELKDAAVKKRPEKRGDALCLRFGDKVAVESFFEAEGSGNAANVALGGAKLGLKTGIWTVLGADDDGKNTLEKVFRPAGLALNNVEFDRKNNTNYALVLSYKAERTILSYHAPRRYVFPANLPAAVFVYLTSLGEGWEKIIPSLLKYVGLNRAFLAFNPGSRQLRNGGQELVKIFEATDLLFVNKEEAQKILGVKTTEVKELLRGLNKKGAKKTVLTDGDKGSFFYDGSVFLKMPILKAKIVERTGCGDAFAAAFIAAKVNKKSDEDALVWGAINSASVLRHVGAHAGLLTKKELLKKI